MGIQLEKKELDEFLSGGHTLILATTKKSGAPFLTPLWYVYHQGSLYVRTPLNSYKLTHIRRDPRVCCLVEEGKRWVDLKAAILNCEAEIIEAGDSRFDTMLAMLDEKYSDYRPDLEAVPDATKSHYSITWALIKLNPKEEQTRSWFNRKLGS